MTPQRPTGPQAASAARRSGPIPVPQPQTFEALKSRVLAKLEDRLDPSTSKRMPASLLRQSIRTHAEQIADQEARGLPRADRDRLVEAVLAELLGYGPLEELFRDPAVREIMVAGPAAVIVRREHEPWLPTSNTYRDEEHLRWSLDKLATNADPIGGVLPSVNTFDLQLPNGFRAIGVIPPPALGCSASVSFLRWEPPAVAEAPIGGAVGRVSGVAASASRPAPGSPASPGRPASDAVATPPPRNALTEPISNGSDVLARHRNRIIERLIEKLAGLGVYDLKRVDVVELRRVVTAYVREYVEKERLFMSEADQCRLMLEILTVMQR